jgi:predicted dienelactone hydrolase
MKTLGIEALALALALCASLARAALGTTELAASASEGPVVVEFPTSAAGLPVRGKGRLIVLSHGSGGSPATYADLAATLVEAGFIVAMPWHRGDNIEDARDAGPASWKRRPAEVSRAIDRVGADPRFAPLLALDKVGMYGMSAGGHTALSLAGGRWSPSRLRRHCEAHIAEDFQACVGLTTSLHGDFLDAPKEAVARWVIAIKLRDRGWYSARDDRIVAVVAGVPFAADFDPASLASPRVALGIVTARRDRWLNPRFHSDAILAACRGCELIADFRNGGHGALLSPLPPHLTGLLGRLIGDPPGFERAEVPAVYRKIADFFRRHLL